LAAPVGDEVRSRAVGIAAAAGKFSQLNEFKQQEFRAARGLDLRKKKVCRT
jgi:hypothetical protein